MNKTIDNTMALNRICRTCDVTCAAEIFQLNSCPKKYDGKMLLDLLTEVTGIDIGKELKEKLPHYVCCTCVRKLQNAYDFVIQARQANTEMLDYLNSINTQCLQNVPVDNCCEQFLVIKLEKEDFYEESITKNTTDLSDHNKLDIKMNTSDDNEIISTKTDPLVINTIIKRTAKRPNKMIDDNSVSSDELDELPLQQRRCKKKPSKKLKTMNGNRKLPETEQFLCNICKQTFLTKNDLDDHFKTHEEENTRTKVTGATLSESRQIKEVDINLCKPHGYKLIQCMICVEKFARISDLRKHLNEHPVISSLTKPVNESLQDVANRLYISFENATEENLLTKVHKDLSDRKFDNFYSITNQCGYELSLSSSETESEVASESESESKESKCKDTRKSYTCELCNKNYSRKYQVYDHQRQEHEWSEAVHVCRRCGGRFVNKQLLEHHYETQCKNAQKNFICRKCPLRFRWKHNLLTHYDGHKKNKETLQCVECNRSYDDKKSYTIHMLKFHGDNSHKLLPCQWCNLKFYRRDYMIKHLKLRHGIREIDLPLAEMIVVATSKSNGDKIIQCKICSLRFDRICDLKEHILLELKLNLSKHQRYESLTNYTITNASGFELHLDDSETDEEDPVFETKQMSYKCEICQVQCKRKFAMFQHQRTMHRFEQLPHSCEKCIFTSVSKEICDHHRSTQCFNKQKKLSCEKCSYKFMWPENLKRHMLLQHSTEIDTEDANVYNSKEAVEETEATAQLQCPHCDKTYQLLGRLNNHIQNVHIDGAKKKKLAERKHLCSLCGKESPSAATLVTHMRRHTGEKPFKCDMCEKAFQRHCEMLQHRRTHTGEKPFHCTVCGKDFAASDKLKRHMLIHSGLKPHKCTFCTKSYRQTKDLKLHMLQHTGEPLFKCMTCGEGFMRKLTLVKHQIMCDHIEQVQNFN